METITLFKTEADARKHRHQHGTGGWIFSPEDGGDVLLFPPSYPPTKVFNHPITKGRSGLLIGSQ